MRWHEIVSETFDDKDLEWEVSNGRQVFRFEVGDQDFTGVFLHGHNNIWNIIFGARTKNTTDFEMGNTGQQGGGAIQVLGHVVQGIKDFLANEQPDELRFAADKQYDNKSSLYTAIARKLKGQAASLGYRTAVDDTDEASFFTLEKIDGDFN